MNLTSGPDGFQKRMKNMNMDLLIADQVLIQDGNDAINVKTLQAAQR